MLRYPVSGTDAMYIWHGITLDACRKRFPSMCQTKDCCKPEHDHHLRLPLAAGSLYFGEYITPYSPSFFSPAAALRICIRSE